MTKKTITLEMIEECPDCGAKIGECHIDGCDVAHCVKCGCQIISNCGCCSEFTDYHNCVAERWYGIHFLPEELYAAFYGGDINYAHVKLQQLIKYGG